MITLNTLPSATAQEVFDQCAQHLIDQGAQSVRDDGMCSYRAGQLKCAAGCFISDAEYKISMEETTWVGLVNEGLVPFAHLELIRNLQYIHDSATLEDWLTELELLAVTQKLNIPDFLQDALDQAFNGACVVNAQQS